MSGTVERLCGHDMRSGRERPFGALFSVISDAAQEVRCDYALCGPMAMGVYGRARMVAGPDLLVAANDLEPLIASIDRDARISRRDAARFRFSTGEGDSVPFWVRGVCDEPALSAIEFSTPVALFGVLVPVAPPAFVFWLLAIGDAPQDRVDAAMMLADEPDLLNTVCERERAHSGWQLQQMQAMLEDMAEMERGRYRALAKHLERQARRPSRATVVSKYGPSSPICLETGMKGARHGQGRKNAGCDHGLQQKGALPPYSACSDGWPNDA